MRSLALRWAKRGDVVERVAAITMLGHLRESSSAPILHSLCDGPNALISIAAAHALLQIEPRFADRFVTLICARADWAPGKLAAIVREKAELLTAPLLDLCRTAGVPAARAAAPYLRYLDAEKAVPVLRTLLQTVSDPETLAAALKALTAIGSAADASAVSKLTADERWQVRLQAANALGALGAQSHIALLAAMLSDSHWWVRYRAAQAIATLSIRSKADITRVLTERDDPFARDALVQALAERGRIVQGAGGR
jgi:HEAT repeat protein